jgi:phosphatidylinositol glycan class V
MRRVKKVSLRLSLKLTRVADRFSQLCLRSFDRNNTLYLFCVVLASRVLKLFLIVCSHSLVPSHDATDVKRIEYLPTTPWHDTLISPFLCWDAAHFISIAVDGYGSSMSYAFFPLFPMVLRYAGMALAAVSPFHLNAIEQVVLAGVIFDNICFTLACFVLNELLRAHNVPAIRRHCAILCCTINPASIFFSMLYTESLFALLSWSGMYLLTVNNQIFLPVVMFAGASFTRSNGIFNSIFVLVFSLSNYVRTVSVFAAVRRALFLLLVFLAAISPYFIHNIYTQYFICSPGNTLQADEALCPPPSDYGYINSNIYGNIQKKYWNVSLFSSYRLEQMPNIALAIPVVILTLRCLWNYGRLVISRIAKNDMKYIQDLDLLPFHAVMVCNLVVALCYAHIQVTTRVLFASCPLIYLQMADILLEMRSGYRTFLVVYILLFNVLSILLHPNFYPWT